MATNVAETSITIDDVTTVIDAGRVKEMGYDSARGIACLQVLQKTMWRRFCLAACVYDCAARAPSSVCDFLQAEMPVVVTQDLDTTSG